MDSGFDGKREFKSSFTTAIRLLRRYSKKWWEPVLLHSFVNRKRHQHCSTCLLLPRTVLCTLLLCCTAGLMDSPLSSAFVPQQIRGP